MSSDFNVATAQRAGYDPDSLLGRRIVDPQEIVRQVFAKASMHLADAITRHGASFEPAVIDPALHLDMGSRLELKIALARVLAVIVSERALDLYGMSVMPFNEIAVVAVHCAHEIRERGLQAGRQAAPKPGGFLRKIERQIG